MEAFNFSEAIKETQALISYADKRINDAKLWELVANNKEKFQKELSEVATILAYVAWMLYPIIPASTEKIFATFGIDPADKKRWEFKFKKSEALFPRL
jgi:methionyl-tRNA synthetase